METSKNTKKETGLVKRALLLFFILLFIDFVLLKLFGELPKAHHSIGWYVFVVETVLCGLSFLAFLVLLIGERSSSHKEKNKKNENSLLNCLISILILIIRLKMSKKGGQNYDKKRKNEKAYVKVNHIWVYFDCI